jgi:hypothetical protein
MEAIENLKNRLIDEILITKNVQLLEAIEKIFTSTRNKNVVSLTSEQIEMLEMSDQDIENGNLVSESDLDKLDKQWFD